MLVSRRIPGPSPASFGSFCHVAREAGSRARSLRVGLTLSEVRSTPTVRIARGVFDCTRAVVASVILLAGIVKGGIGLGAAAAGMWLARIVRGRLSASAFRKAFFLGLLVLCIHLAVRSML
jgi:hypothetical protein